MKLWTLLFVLYATGMSSAQVPWNPTRPVYQQPLNYVPGAPINIEQLEAETAYNPGVQQNYNQGTPFGNQQQGFQQQGFQQQGSPIVLQQNGIPITGYPNTIQQTGYPINQQYIPQTLPFGGAPGPITFPG